MATVDVPSSGEDGYNNGSGGLWVATFKTGTTGISSLSSSSGGDENQFDSFHLTTTANLQALGMPAGSTITAADYGIWPTAQSNNSVEAWFLQTFTTPNTLSSSTWNTPNSGISPSTWFALVLSGGWTLNQYNFLSIPLGQLNTSGNTNVQTVCNAVSTFGSATFMTSENSANHPPIIRVTYTPPVAGGGNNLLPLLGVT